MNIASILRLPTLVAVIASLVAATPANANQASSAGNEDHRFDLAIVDSIPRDGAIGVLVRPAGQTRNDIVLLKSSEATPELLYSALSQLEAERAFDPPVTATTYEFITSAKSGGSVPEQRLARFQAMLIRVLGRPFTRVGNLGTGRWDTISDPGIRARKRV